MLSTITGTAFAFMEGASKELHHVSINPVTIRKMSEVKVSVKPRIQVFLKDLYDEKAIEVARRMPFLKKDHQVGVTYLNGGRGGEGVFADSGIELTCIDVEPLPPEDALNSIDPFMAAFKRNTPDVAMAALPDDKAAAFLIAAKASGVSMVIAEIDDQPSLLSSFEELTALYFCDLILPATRGLQRTVTQVLPQLSKRVGNLLPHSADTTYIQLTKEDRRRLRQELHVDTEMKMITMIAPFDRRRDYDTLLEACAILKHRGHEFVVLLVGDGPERRRLAEKVYALRLEDQVTIIDDPGDHIDILCATDIFALSTHFESNSIPLIEAMAQGLAIAGTDIPGINDLLRDERSGRLAQPKSAESFAEALADLLAQEKIRKKLGSVARKCIENRGNLNQFMPPFINTIKKKLTEKIPVKKDKSGTIPLKELADKYIDLQQYVQELCMKPDSEFGITEAANLMDSFPINVQVDILEKLCAVPVESAPLAVFVRPLEKVLSDRFFEQLPLLEMRLLEKLSAFYIELGYIEGAEKLIERLEANVGQELFRYHFTNDRYSGLRTHVRLSQLHDLVGHRDKRDFYRLELWEYLREPEENHNPFFHQQNAAILESLGEEKLALREMQKDALDSIQIDSGAPVAYRVKDEVVVTDKSEAEETTVRKYTGKIKDQSEEFLEEIEQV